VSGHGERHRATTRISFASRGSPKRAPPPYTPACVVSECPVRGQVGAARRIGFRSSERRSVRGWVGRLEPGSGQELAAAWLADDLAIVDDHVAAGDDCDRPSGDLVTVVWLEI